jgi:hypothetical protein
MFSIDFALRGASVVAIEGRDESNAKANPQRTNADCATLNLLRMMSAISLANVSELLMWWSVPGSSTIFPEWTAADLFIRSRMPVHI